MLRQPRAEWFEQKRHQRNEIREDRGVAHLHLVRPVCPERLLKERSVSVEHPSWLIHRGVTVHQPVSLPGIDDFPTSNGRRVLSNRQLKRRLDKGEVKACGYLSRAEGNRLLAAELAKDDRDGNSRLVGWPLRQSNDPNGRARLKAGLSLFTEKGGTQGHKVRKETKGSCVSWKNDD
jgi:hypothetical protein